MKSKLIFLALATTAILVFAGQFIPPYDDSKTPPISLPVAYQEALVGLGGLTNSFHCVSARATRDVGCNGWMFAFYSTNSPPKQKIVIVNFDHTTKVEDYHIVFQ